MIRLNKTERPEILVDNEQAWNDAYMALRLAGERNSTIESRHRHPEIKSALIVETNGKCAFCEEKILSSQFGDVEHLRPKAIYPALYVSWNNLTLACIRCNNGKGEIDGLLNPYEDEPSNFFQFLGPMISYAPGLDRAELTLSRLQLNRMELINKRTERCSQAQRLLNIYVTREAGPLKDAAAEELREFVQSDKEFSAAVRGYVERLGFGYLLAANET